LLSGVNSIPLRFPDLVLQSSESCVESRREA
jgi:hypothetical protein